MAEESLPSAFDMDDFSLSAPFGGENQEGNKFPVSNAEFSEELQFHEPPMASTINTQMPKASSTSSSSLIMQANMVAKPEIIEVDDESSRSFCEICAESKDNDQMFRIESCIHSFCSECISKHVGTKIQDGIINVTCPGLNCRSILELDACRAVLSKEVLALWDQVLCLELIDVSQRVYCPYKDCLAMLVKENEGEKVVRESECPFCHRLFCAQCYVAWHIGIDCEEYQRLNADERGREDLMLRELAKEKKWSRCPHCKFYVERTEGCPHMTCRCGFQFCYGCESEWTESHGGCSRE